MYQSANRGENMSNIIMGFRESLEAILLIGIIIVYLRKNNLASYIKYAYYGFGAGVIISLVIAVVIQYLNQVMTSKGEVVSLLWEFGSSLVSSILLGALVIGMLKSNSNMRQDIEDRASQNSSTASIFFISLLMVAREGFELVLFVMANPETSNVIFEVLIGIGIAILLGYGLNNSIIKVNLKAIFSILLIYLILQIGALLGGSIGELLELLEYLNIAPENSLLYGDLYNLSNTILGLDNLIGSVLNFSIGWNPSPKLLQFIAQYSITGYLLFRYSKRYN